jgi:hypothetical protein
LDEFSIAKTSAMTMLSSLTKTELFAKRSHGEACGQAVARLNPLKTWNENGVAYV